MNMEKLDSSKSRDFDNFAKSERDLRIKQALKLPERFDPVITNSGLLTRDVNGKLVVWDNKFHTYIAFEPMSGTVYFQMEASLTVRLPKPLAPPKNMYDRKEPEQEYRTLDIKFEGDSEIYSKILKKLEEMANGNGWELK